MFACCCVGAVGCAWLCFAVVYFGGLVLLLVGMVCLVLVVVGWFCCWLGLCLVFGVTCDCWLLVFYVVFLDLLVSCCFVIVWLFTTFGFDLRFGFVLFSNLCLLAICDW